jgi:hypothetical protein
MLTISYRHHPLYGMTNRRDNVPFDPQYFEKLKRNGTHLSSEETFRLNPTAPTYRCRATTPYEPYRRATTSIGFKMSYTRKPSYTGKARP